MKPINYSNGLKEEITDLISDKAFTARDEDGNYVFHKGKVLKFNYEDSITTIKITRIDRKNKRAWGQHVELINQKLVYSHLGHDVNITAEPKPFCRDCMVPIDQPSTEDGEVRAKDRADKTLSDGTVIGIDEN